MPPPTICLAQEQSSSVSPTVNWYQFTINSESSWLSLPSDKSDLVKWLFKKNNFFGCLWCRICRSKTREHNKLSEAESSWIFLSISSPCKSSRSNQHCKLKSYQTWVWTSQGFLSLLTWSNKHFTISAYGMEKEGQKSPDISWACLLPFTSKEGDHKGS